MASASTPTTSPDPDSWRAEIRALCGGETLGEMWRWLEQQDGWLFSLHGGEGHPGSGSEAFIEVNGESLASGFSDDPAEALARAILRAHAATEGR